MYLNILPLQLPLKFIATESPSDLSETATNKPVDC